VRKVVVDCAFWNCIEFRHSNTVFLFKCQLNCIHDDFYKICVQQYHYHAGCFVYPVESNHIIVSDRQTDKHTHTHIHIGLHTNRQTDRQMKTKTTRGSVSKKHKIRAKHKLVCNYLKQIKVIKQLQWIQTRL